MARERREEEVNSDASWTEGGRGEGGGGRTLTRRRKRTRDRGGTAEGQAAENDCWTSHAP